MEQTPEQIEQERRELAEWARALIAELEELEADYSELRNNVAGRSPPQQ